MQEQGVVPEVITYNALISVCGKGTQPERGLEPLRGNKAARLGAKKSQLQQIDRRLRKGQAVTTSPGALRGK